MTPSALTPAARGAARKPPADRPKRPVRPTAGPAPPSGSPQWRSTASTSSSARSAGHRSGVTRPVSPRTSRRVSGPLGGAPRAAATPTAVAPAPARTRPASPRPLAPRPGTRRTSDPRRTAKAARGPWPARCTGYVRALPDHALLDRIIRGRAWIPLLGVLLVGIVAMQVEVLKLNAGIGRSLDRATALQGQNELLRSSVSQLSDEQRIESIAAQKGMVMAIPAEMKFLATGAGVTQRALTSIHQPDAASFTDALTAANAAELAASGQAGATSATPGATDANAASASISSAGTSGSTDASDSADAATSGSTVSSATIAGQQSSASNPGGGAAIGVGAPSNAN
jgi:cell division protein FtsL